MNLEVVYKAVRISGTSIHMEPVLFCFVLFCFHFFPRYCPQGENVSGRVWGGGGGGLVRSRAQTLFLARATHTCAYSGM